MVTTNYIGIKDYSKENSQITLASMGFDEETLMPTYKLLLNVIGRSYALEISSRLGLKKEIIEKARTYKSNKANDLDSIIDELSMKLKQEDNYIASLKEKENQLDLKISEIEKEKEKLKNNYDKAIQEVNNKKEELLLEAYEEINQIVEEFKKSSQNEGFKHHLKNQAIEKLEKLSSLDEQESKIKGKVAVGDMAKISSVGKIVKVIEIKNDKCVVLANNTTMIVKITDLEKLQVENKITKKNVKHNAFDNLQRSIPMSLNLIGMHVEEALIALQNYLDAALLVKYSQVNIIHGYGTGALRKAVHDYLKNCKFVSEYRLGGYNEGGSGATVVILKVKK